MTDLALRFDEILPGKSVRITEDKLVYAIDLTMAITGILGDSILRIA